MERERQKNADTPGPTGQGYLCVNCGDALVERSMECKRCQMRFPVIDGTVPVLVRDPRSLLANAALSLCQQIVQHEERIKAIETAQRDRLYRSSARKPLVEAIRANLRFLERLETLLEPHVTAKELLRHTMRAYPNAEHTRQVYTQIFSNLARDWGGTKEGEREIAVTLASVRNSLTAASVDRSQVLLLGAGCARYAAELTRDFQVVHAMDLSLPMAGGFIAARSGEGEVFEIREKNVRSLDDRMTRIPLGKFRGEEGSGALRFCVGDALAPPFAHESMSAVLSIFFTDVVPFHLLLPKMKRLLKPGGAFVHFGPLQYHFSDESSYLTLDELLAELEAHGFDVMVGDSVPLLHCQPDGALTGQWYDCASFAAVRRPLDSKSVLKLRPGIQLSYQSDDSIAVIEGDELSPKEYSGALAATLGNLDGKKTIAQLIDAVGGDADAETVSKMIALCEELLDGRVIAVSKGTPRR